MTKFIAIILLLFPAFSGVAAQVFQTPFPTILPETEMQDTGIQVDVRCAGDLMEGLPPNFGGTIYSLLTPYSGYATWQLEAISATETQLTNIPVPQALFEAITPVEMSPDSRYLLFGPVRLGTSLAVWDTVSNEFKSLELPEETVFYLDSSTDSNWRQQRKIDWISPDQFVIRYFDLENNFFLNQLAEQIFTVMQNPLIIVAGQQQTIEYPALPFRRDDYENTISYSPQNTYVQASYWDELLRWPDLRFQIYATQTLELVADFNSTETFVLSAPQWSYDESVLFLQYRPEIGRLPWITEIDVGAGFQESPDLLNTLLQTFGSDFRLSGLGSDPSPNSPHLLFTMTSSDLMPYAVVYDYEAHTLKAVCRGATASEANITGSHSYPVWGPDEDIIGFYDAGNLYLFDTVSGQSYYKSVYPFVGWIETPEHLQADGK